ncbi:kanadaptin-like isoform X1 [Salvia splendens]|uniref:kanadaptin-like isoform X1 n=1 Tax=Salvia splendens TaxID=180675 RepID=UPI001C273A07|nr:kanadaptin-like isoform X1 [Salvia splendens]
MATSMGSPPPKNTTADDAAVKPSTSEPTAMPPPPPRLSNPSKPEPAAELSQGRQEEAELNTNSSISPGNSDQASNSSENPSNGETKQEQPNSNSAVPYKIPPWSAPPGHEFFLEVLKDGAIIDRYDVHEKGAYMFGRVDICDFVLEHPTISRFHAVLQFKSDRGVYLYDLGSTHGTFINKNQVKKRIYVDLHVGDVLRFGHSSRLYIFQGPSELMPPEADLKRLRKAKMQQETKDMEASLLRAKIEASHADGISWGMGEDAEEELEDEAEEITWQTYKGQLTEKQEKTRDKVIKRLEKIAHMKKEIDAIRAKDIAQGGLTQGQQTQIARNEQRTSQIMEELENLEETLNESIRESIGAKAGKLPRGKHKGPMGDDEEDYMSDDDDFYDRTKKSSKPKNGESQSVETADSLLDKKDALVKQIEDKEKLLADEDKSAAVNEIAEAGDALDAYMSAVSSQLVSDKKGKIQKDLSTLQSELDRIVYLLRIADPSGEAVRKRQSKDLKPKMTIEKPVSHAGNKSAPETNKKIDPSPVKSKTSVPEVSLVKTMKEKATVKAKSEPDSTKDEPEFTNNESTSTAYTVAKPQWLGAVDDIKKQEPVLKPTETQESDEFVDYKDRTSILNKPDSADGIEDAAPGLIIRKRKQVGPSKASDAVDSETAAASHFKAEDAVALLLKHSKGYHAADDEDGAATEDVPENEEKEKTGGKKKKVLGPEKPSFLDEPDYSSWVPPKGQSGDGRTSLNDRFGY